ncbi:hypothetical protein VCHC17A1_3924, partial [Vibrio cholerae HC-17A1]
MYTNL